MNRIVKTNIVLLPTILFTTLLLASCASDPIPADDPYNQADSQRSRAKQTQDELSSETRQK